MLPTPRTGIRPSFGAVAQLVEQRPEEPCVTGSSPVGATKQNPFGIFLLPPELNTLESLTILIRYAIIQTVYLRKGGDDI